MHVYSRKICYVYTFKICIYNINFIIIDIYMEIIAKYIVYVCVLSRGEESHDKDWVINARRVDLLWPEGSAKQRENPQGCSGADSALFLLLQCSESVLCFSGCCSVTRCYLWEKRDGKWVLSLMEKSPHVLGLRGLCSHPMTSRRCDRSACD